MSSMGVLGISRQDHIGAPLNRDATHRAVLWETLEERFFIGVRRSGPDLLGVCTPEKQ